MSLTGHLDKLNRCGIIKTQKRGEIKVDIEKLDYAISILQRLQHHYHKTNLERL